MPAASDGCQLLVQAVSDKRGVVLCERVACGVSDCSHGDLDWVLRIDLRKLGDGFIIRVGALGSGLWVRVRVMALRL